MRPGRFLFALLGALFAVGAGSSPPAGDPRPRHSWEPEEHVVGPLAPEVFAARLPQWDVQAQAFVPAPDVVARMRASAPATIEVVFGTWCSDSKRDVPRFLKIADLAGIPSGRIRLHGVDRASRRVDALADQFAVRHVRKDFNRVPPVARLDNRSLLP